MFSFFLPDWRYNHAGKHRSSILYLCWSWLVNGFVFNVQPASRCTARTSWPHVILFNLNSKRTTGCAILFQISKWHLKNSHKGSISPPVQWRAGSEGLQLSSISSLVWILYRCSRPAGSESVLWLLQLYPWPIKIFVLPCEISQRALDGLSVRTSWLTGWVMLALPSLCQHRHQSFQKSWTVTFPWPQPLYLQITMVC